MNISEKAERAEALGFREWTSHYEKEQEADRKKINDLAAAVGTINQSVGALTADVRTLIDNQKGMFNRINRPVQWGVMVAAAALVAGTLGLVTAPMKEDIQHVQQLISTEAERNLELHVMFNQRLGEQIKLSTKNEINTEWIMKMEERLNNRLHPGMSQ